MNTSLRCEYRSFPLTAKFHCRQGIVFNFLLMLQQYGDHCHNGLPVYHFDKRPIFAPQASERLGLHADSTPPPGDRIGATAAAVLPPLAATTGHPDRIYRFFSIDSMICRLYFYY
jgi:hypothetical protein